MSNCELELENLKFELTMYFHSFEYDDKCSKKIMKTFVRMLQVNLRSAGRKRFAHLSASQDEIHVDAPVPWGEDTLFTLEFRAAATADNDAGPGHGHGGKAEGGHYALHTCNNKYLARDGKLLDSCTRECLYAAEFHAGLLALR